MSDPNTMDFQPIPTFTPQTPVAEGPTVSTPQTITGIFFEPGPTFEALRVRPRFLVVGIISVLIFMVYYSTFVWRVGSENIARAQITARQPDATPEQIEQGLSIQGSVIVKAITYASFPVVFAVMFAGGAGLYLLGTMMMAKSLSFKQALAVWVYSSFPPLVVFAIINIILLFLKSADDIDATALNTGIAKANPSFLVDGKAHALLATFLGSFDLIAFYGLFLAALGLRKVAKLTSGSAWAIVIAIWILGIVLRLGIAAITGGAA
jgi:Yip1 domain